MMKKIIELLLKKKKKNWSLDVITKNWSLDVITKPLMENDISSYHIKSNSKMMTSLTFKLKIRRVNLSRTVGLHFTYFKKLIQWF